MYNNGIQLLLIFLFFRWCGFDNIQLYEGVVSSTDEFVKPHKRLQICSGNGFEQTKTVWNQSFNIIKYCVYIYIYIYLNFGILNSWNSRNNNNNNNFQ